LGKTSGRRSEKDGARYGQRAGTVGISAALVEETFIAI